MQDGGAGRGLGPTAGRWQSALGFESGSWDLKVMTPMVLCRWPCLWLLSPSASQMCPVPITPKGSQARSQLPETQRHLEAGVSA